MSRCSASGGLPEPSPQALRKDLDAAGLSGVHVVLDLVPSRARRASRQLAAGGARLGSTACSVAFCHAFTIELMDVVLPTLAVALFWVFWGLVLAGCGFFLRRLLGRALLRSGRADRPCSPVDLWIGLAGLVAYLLLWNLLFAITLGGRDRADRARRRRPALGGRRLSRPRWDGDVDRDGRGRLVSILWLANASLAVADDYDFGLYHLNLIDYAKRYAAVPGLADLHVRLGAGDAHLLFVALLDRGPLSRARAPPRRRASRVAADLRSRRRFAFRPASAWFSSFTSTLALLLIPTTVIVAALRPTQRISSPNLDFAAFVLVVVGILYLAECVENGLRAPAALGATAALATAAATRPLYWLWVVFAVAVLVLFTGSRPPRGRATALLTVGAIPAVIGDRLARTASGAFRVPALSPHARRASGRLAPAGASAPGGDTSRLRLGARPRCRLRTRCSAPGAGCRTTGSASGCETRTSSCRPRSSAAPRSIVLARGAGSAWRERRRPMLVGAHPVAGVDRHLVRGDPRSPVRLGADLARAAGAARSAPAAPRSGAPLVRGRRGGAASGSPWPLSSPSIGVYFVPAAILAVGAAAVARRRQRGEGSAWIAPCRGS